MEIPKACSKGESISPNTSDAASAATSAFVSESVDDKNVDLLLAIAKARAKEGSISYADNATTATTTRMCCTGDDGSTTMTGQEEENTTIDAESKMASGSGLAHKNCTKNQQKDTTPTINSAPEEVFDILDVVRERHETTDSISTGIRYQKEMEKQKNNTTEVITSKSHSSINPTTNVDDGGAERLDTNKKNTNNGQQNHNVAEQFDVMDAVLKRAALINNEESNGSVVVPEPPQSIERQRPVIPVVSQPGAYSGAPGEGLQRRDDMRFSLVGALGALGRSRAVLEDRTTAEEDIGVAERTNHNEPILTNTDQSAGLAEATPVDDNDFIAPDVEAQPFDVDEAEKRKSTSERTYRAKLGLVAVLIVAFVATVPVLVLKNRQEEHHLALAPSVAPSDAPSEIPSSAPTGSLDFMIVNLPKNTIEKLGNSSTPQWKAMEWLSRHPQLPGMEEWRKTQLFALATFYYSFEGEKWNKVIQERWMDYEKEECRWFSSGLGYFDDDGVYVDQDARFLSDPCNDAGEFISVHLENLQLSGLVPTMPPEIALLTSLSVLLLGVNDIHASFSDMLIPELFQLTNITQLSFGFSALSGTIPTELGLMSGMKMLSLWGNSLTGLIPTELALLSNMTMLFLNRNQLTGAIPTELVLMRGVEEIFLGSNLLSGMIPTALALLSNMTKLYLNNNQLTGEIPSQLGLMTNMERLYLWGNTLKGGIPKQLGMMTKLEVLTLRNNFLTGTIHDSIWSLKNLTNFYLNANNLSGSIATKLGLMKNLLDLKLELNSFSSLIPSEVGLLTSLEKASLHNNSLTGPVPKELELVAINGSLGLLTLETNDLSGIVPEGLCSLGQYNDTLGFGLSFDCGEHLCGCDWCMYGRSNSSSPSGTQGVNGT